MKLVFIGDIFGNKGREAVKKELPNVIKKYSPDIIIANGENTTHGRSMNLKHFQELLKYGITHFTFGNHTWQNPEIKNILNHENVVRPLNINKENKESEWGKGTRLFNINNKKIRLTNLLGESINMQGFQTNPFLCFENLLKNEKSDIHFVDFHCETTSEKNAFFIAFCDKMKGAIVGTHTHVPTNDSKIFLNCAFLTDVGMCGGSLGVIGADSKEIVATFMEKQEKFKMIPSLTKYQFNAVFIEFDEETNNPIKIESIIKYEE